MARLGVIMINNFGKPVIGYVAKGYPKLVALAKLRKLLWDKHEIYVEKEHMSFNDDTGEWFVTYDPDTHEYLHP